MSGTMDQSIFRTRRFSSAGVIGGTSCDTNSSAASASVTTMPLSVEFALLAILYYTKSYLKTLKCKYTTPLSYTEAGGLRNRRIATYTPPTFG